MNSKNPNEKYLVFTASDREYFLPVEEVDGVLSLHRSGIFPVPFDRENRIRGIFYYKGSAVGVLRCDGITARSDEKGDENLTAVLIRLGEKHFAVLVDRVNTVASVEQGSEAVGVNARTLYGGVTDADN